MNHYYWEIMRYLERMGPREWVMVSASLIALGLYCLRGFGSRSQY